MKSLEVWRELNKMIAQYDWAVEGYPAPASNDLTREQAVELRNSLVKLAGEA